MKKCISLLVMLVGFTASQAQIQLLDLLGADDSDRVDFTSRFDVNPMKSTLVLVFDRAQAEGSKIGEAIINKMYRIAICIAFDRAQTEEGAVIDQPIIHKMYKLAVILAL